jgi:cation diffusion facilitator CzcD-associated flavoprotein CzcO
LAVTTSDVSPIAIIGAGPNGLSLAAHLVGRNVRHRIFGEPMGFWAHHMPKGMELKSDGFATSLYDPARSFAYPGYCKDHAIAYDGYEIRVKLDDFVRYGRAFQERFAPELDRRLAKAITRDADGFRISFAAGPDCLAQNLVLAVGPIYFATLPQGLEGLPQDLVSHSSACGDLDRFKGKKVAVIGAGSSATDIAALLHEAGAETHLIVRGHNVPFQSKMRLPRPLYERIRHPGSRVGPGVKGFLYDHFPAQFRSLPLKRRARIVNSFLGPAGCYFVRDRVIGRVDIHLGLQPVRAEAANGRIAMTLANVHGEERRFEADHVICATGYRTDIGKLPFLSDDLKQDIAHHQGAPLLSSHFESSVRGLYFTGLSSALTFGPVVRFACGADFTSARLGAHLAGRARA